MPERGGYRVPHVQPRAPEITLLVQPGPLALIRLHRGRQDELRLSGAIELIQVRTGHATGKTPPKGFITLLDSDEATSREFDTAPVALKQGPELRAKVDRTARQGGHRVGRGAQGHDDLGLAV